ncbi:zinc finger protein 888-like [Sabethes cyaneus]|uniref:zinc finger protein 888-like n=1 Tax=Sabethes cyaneus TaxID=53552 RepID=UPI00237ECE91|nr:zinc finger protein 888-like [Sabethes cyaneus]
MGITSKKEEQNGVDSRLEGSIQIKTEWPLESMEPPDDVQPECSEFITENIDTDFGLESCIKIEAACLSESVDNWPQKSTLKEEPSNAKSPYGCEAGDVHVEDSNSLKLHRRKIHWVKEKYECDICGYKAARKVFLEKHMLSVHIGEKPYICTVCGKSYESRSKLRTHRRNVHRKESKAHLTKKETGKNIDENAARLPQKCKTDTRITSEAQNSNNTKNYNPHKCNICGKEFTRKGGLQKHQLIHTNEQPDRCPICHKSFTYKHYVAVHMRLHTGEQQYRCEICDKGYNRRELLLAHRRSVHTGERPHKCEICDRRFATQIQRNTHMRIHTAERKHKCDVCEKAFLCQRQLRRHRTVHSGVMLAHCTVCGKGYIDNYNLKIHMAVHTGEKLPHGCDLCEKSFGTASRLSQHKLVHSTGGGKKR